MKIVISSEYKAIESQLRTLLVQDSPSGEILCDARNLIVRTRIGNTDLVIKRYGRPYFFNRIAYTLFRKSKPERAYLNAQRLLAMGYSTPRAIAYATHHSGGLYDYGTFICPYCPYPTVASAVADPDALPKELLDALAAYTAQMHQDGIYFYDYNLGNILYDCSDGTYRFTLIDCNRINFYATPISFHKCVSVLYCLNFSPEQYIYFMCKYAHYRNVNWKIISGAVLLKQELSLTRRIKHWFKRTFRLTNFAAGK